MSSLTLKTGLSNILPDMCADEYLSMIGIEYEVIWIVPTVTALTGKVYLRWTTSVDKYTITNFRQVVMDQERGFYRVYRDDDFSGGTPGSPLPINKLRFDSTVDPDLVPVPLTGPTITGTASVVEPMFGQAGQGVIRATGGTTSEQALRISPPGTIFLSEFENLSAEDSYFQLNVHWWEITPEAMLAIKEL